MQTELDFSQNLGCAFKSGEYRPILQPSWEYLKRFDIILGKLSPKIMKTTFQSQSPTISLTVLGTLCFVTLFMCQTRFKITKEINHEVYPPVLRSKDYWFLYTIGNPDRFRCVLKAFVVITSPVLSLISTALLIFGKIESNPYFFIPWLFLTIKGLLLVQTDNIITMLKDMGNRANYVFGFRVEDVKWLLFYSTVFMIDLVEAFSFCEILDLFLVIWNHHPGFNAETKTLEAVKKEIADIMETLSKCSLGSLSKISLSSAVDSEENAGNEKKPIGVEKYSSKRGDKIFEENETPESLLKVEPFVEEELKHGTNASLKSITKTSIETENTTKNQNGDFDDLYLMRSSKLNLSPFSKPDFRDTSERSSESYCKEFEVNVV